MLGLSIAKKKAKVKQLYEEKKNRMLTKLTFKQKINAKKQHLDKFHEEQEEFEQQNMGRYERIFPLSVREAQLDNQSTQENPTLTTAQKQLAQQSYQALVR